MQPDDLNDLKSIQALREHPGLASTTSDVPGTPIEEDVALLPNNWPFNIGDSSHAAITRAVQILFRTIKD
jgi:hypothetical protein